MLLIKSWTVNVSGSEPQRYPLYILLYGFVFIFIILY